VTMLGLIKEVWVESKHCHYCGQTSYIFVWPPCVGCYDINWLHQHLPYRSRYSK